MTKTTFPLPREHGASVMLAVSVLAGLATSHQIAPIAASAFVVGAVVSHLARPAAAACAMARSDAERRGSAAWLVLYGAAELIAGAVLLFIYRRWWLLAVAAAGVLAALLDIVRQARRRPQSIAVQAAGAFAMALLAPGAYYAASGRLGGAALALTVGMTAHLLSRVWVVTAHVHWRKTPVLDQAARWRPAWPGPAIVLAGLVAAWTIRRISGWPVPWVWALLLDLIMATASVSFGRRDTPFKTIGLAETVESTLFAIVLTVILRLM